MQINRIRRKQSTYTTYGWQEGDLTCFLGGADEHTQEMKIRCKRDFPKGLVACVVVANVILLMMLTNILAFNTHTIFDGEMKRLTPSASVRPSETSRFFFATSEQRERKAERATDRRSSFSPPRKEEQEGEKSPRVEEEKEDYRR